MIEIKGKFNSAKIFTDNVEQEAIAQIIALCNQPFTQGQTIRMMPIFTQVQAVQSAQL